MSQTALFGDSLSVEERLRMRGVLPLATAIASKRAVPLVALLGRARTTSVSAARRELCFALRSVYGMSYPEIGWLLDRDHTTIMYLLSQTVRTRTSETVDSRVRVSTDLETA